LLLAFTTKLCYVSFNTIISKLNNKIIVHWILLKGELVRDCVANDRKKYHFLNNSKGTFYNLRQIRGLFVVFDFKNIMESVNEKNIFLRIRRENNKSSKLLTKLMHKHQSSAYIGLLKRWYAEVKNLYYCVQSCV
jgi:hypothetical protein